jgi:hypothetical protein
MGKVTYEQVKRAFEERGYELLSTEYVNCSTKLAYICLKHQYTGVQYVDWAHFSRDQGCRCCGKENKRNGREKPLEDYNAKVLVESKGLEFVKITRENSKLCIYYICPKHREVGTQKTSLESIRRMKIGCPYCIGRNKTTESFRAELFNLNPNIRVRGEYINAATSIECECLIDGTIWSPTPNALLCGQGCPECGRIASNLHSTKSNDMFVTQLYNMNPDILPLQEYVQSKIPIWVMCKKCGHKWQSTPDSLLHGSGCLECLKQELHDTQAKSNEKFLEELAKANPMLRPLDPYYNDHTKIRVECLIHHYIWPAAPNKILRRHTGCPKCSMYTNEQKIAQYFSGRNEDIEPQKRYDDCRDKNPLPFDIYVSKYNLLIEYQGEQHYKPIRRGSMTEDEALEQLRITQYHDKIKLEYCVKNNIPLVRVPYWKQDNIEDFLINECKQYGIILTQQNDYS